MHKARLIKGMDDQIVDLATYIISFGALLIVLCPLLFILSASVSEPKLVTMGKVFLLPKEFTLEGYKMILDYRPIWIGYRNTIFYTGIGTAINVFMTVTCAYPLSRKDLAGRNFFIKMFTFTMFFNGGLIPTYLVIKQLNIINTVWAMWLPVAVSVWNIIICRTFFENSIPYELQEAASSDGCTDIGILLKIILPLSKPILAVLVLFYAVSHWNTYFNALIYLNNENLYPLQLFLRRILIMDQMTEMMGADPELVEQLIRRMELKDSMKFGIIAVSSLPIIAVYPFIQKYFVKGVMVGAVKG